MIEFEIENSPDVFVNGCHKYHFNALSIGNHEMAFFPIHDQAINNCIVNLFIKNDNLYLKTGSKNTLLNQKLANGTIGLNINDEITIGSSKIKIKSFIAEKSIIERSKLKDILSKYPERKSDLIKLEEILNMLDREIHNA